MNLKMSAKVKAKVCIKKNKRKSAGKGINVVNILMFQFTRKWVSRSKLMSKKESQFNSLTHTKFHDKVTDM